MILDLIINRQFLVSRKHGEEAQDFQIQPNERDQQAHCRKPLHVLRCAVHFTFFKVVEIEQQVHGSDGNDDQADADADRAGLVQIRHGDAKKRKHDRNYINQRHSAGSHHDAYAELVVYLDDARFKDEQHSKKHAERQGNRLKNDAVEHTGVNRGDGAHEQAFQTGINWRQGGDNCGRKDMMSTTMRPPIAPPQRKSWLGAVKANAAVASMINPRINDLLMAPWTVIVAPPVSAFS